MWEVGWVGSPGASRRSLQRNTSWASFIKLCPAACSDGCFQRLPVASRRGCVVSPLHLRISPSCKGVLLAASPLAAPGRVCGLTRLLQKESAPQHILDLFHGAASGGFQGVLLPTAACG